MEENQGCCLMDFSLLNASDEAGASLLRKSLSESEINREDAELTSCESEFNDIQAESVDEWPSYDYIAGRNLTGGQYCCVPLCRSSSGQRLERERLGMARLSFHSFPGVKSDKDDYISGDATIHSKRRVLKATAVPLIFPWTVEKLMRTSMTSKLAISPDQRCDMVESVEVDDFTCDDEAAAFETHDDLDSAQEIKCQCEYLKKKIEELQCSLAELKSELQRSLFRFENIKDDDEMVKFYTGIPDQATLMAFYEEILEDDAKSMRLWIGKNSKDCYADSKTGRHPKLPLLEQFFLTLVRLCLGLLEQDLANRVSVSVSSVSRITATWINLMYHSFKAIERFPPWHIVEKHMPDTFRKEYPNTRLIIDTTELQVERPSSLLTQSCTFSAYKNRNTVKVLIGILPSGVIAFVSPTYEGSISDKELTQVCGILDKREYGDEIMAYKGFQIQDLLAPLGVRLNVPPFLNSKVQMPVADVLLTRKIAHLRIHVERAIGRVKDFQILQHTLPATMWDSINEVICVCCMLTNLSPPLVA
ncbi:uncharacterized protein [Dysidea avara]|uniref:uncharacterized protein n=1 Tax=Dysidea avara TaxID=196820 RepID=UPI0033211DC4